MCASENTEPTRAEIANMQSDTTVMYRITATIEMDDTPEAIPSESQEHHFPDLAQAQCYGFELAAIAHAARVPVLIALDKLTSDGSVEIAAVRVQAMTLRPLLGLIRLIESGDMEQIYAYLADAGVTPPDKQTIDKLGRAVRSDDGARRDVEEPHEGPATVPRAQLAGVGRGCECGGGNRRINRLRSDVPTLADVQGGV